MKRFVRILAVQRRVLLALCTAGLAVPAGCMPGDESAPGTVPQADSLPVADSGVAPPVGDTAAPPESGGQTAVSTEGMGALRIGMSVHALAPHLAAGTDTAALAECDYVRITGAPDSVRFMVVDGRLARIDVVGGPTATAEGARTGDPERRIEALYPVLRRMPHKYTDGFYLVAFPAQAPDTLHRYVFETDGQRVTRYRAGVYPPVEYVEGCS